MFQGDLLEHSTTRNHLQCPPLLQGSKRRGPFSGLTRVQMQQWSTHRHPETCCPQSPGTLSSAGLGQGLEVCISTQL